MIYIDTNDFHCYIAQNSEGTLLPYEDAFFEGKCQTFIEGYCCIPDGYELVNSDGSVYKGKAIYPWKSHRSLILAQHAYERNLLSEYEDALRTVRVIT